AERVARIGVAIKALLTPRPEDEVPPSTGKPADDRTKLMQHAVATCADRIKSACAFLVDRVRGTRLGDRPDIALAVATEPAFKGALRIGLRVLIISVSVLGGWATFVPLSGAVVVPGALVVESQVKKVQHLTGGVVARIKVKDGSHVEAGDVVARLD